MTPATEKFHPVEVKLVEAEGRLVVTWNDGHVSDFPLRYLRGFCPCATCQGHRSGPPEFVPNQDEKVADVQPVGSYGMVVAWESGHNTGIYSFDYLRRLDPEKRYGRDGIPAEFR